jgi:hypothetical protein
MTSILLVLRSLWVSVTGFWRYLVVLPFLLAVVLAVLIVYTVTARIFFGLVLALPLVIAGLFVFAFLVAIRTAFASVGEYGSPMFFRLMKAGLIFAVIQGVLYFVIEFNGFQGLLLAEGLSFWDIRHVLETAAEQGEARVALSMWNPLIWIVIVLFLAAVIYVSVGILVPMAASAWSASEERAPVDPIWGFGSQFLPLAVVVGVTYLVQSQYGTNAKTFWLFGLVIGNFFDWISARDVEWPETAHLLDLTGGFLLGSFLYYWQACAAALAFLAERKRREIVREAALFTPEAARVDPRSLRKARDLRG